MVFEHVVPALFSYGAGGVLGSGLDMLDSSNGLFGSIVAVTGDAHQAQVAQDIFRQEVRIERSLRVREDIRDAHRLMIDNVQTQLLMGNIVLGVCFAVLIEGRPSDPIAAPVVVQELWALFSMWSVSLTILSVWYALHFQAGVSVDARRRLLEKHRICSPNDDVVGRLGGLPLLEKVAQLHQGGLDWFVQGPLRGWQGKNKQAEEATEQNMLEEGPDIEANPDDENLKRMIPRLPIADIRADARMALEAKMLQFNLDVERADRRDKEDPELEVDVWDGAAAWPPPIEHVGLGRPKKNGYPLTVRVGRGTRAWFNEERDALEPHHIVDLPDFLEECTLVRCTWEIPEPCNRRSLRLMVKGAATIYVAAQWPKRDRSEAYRAQGPPPVWRDKELPVLKRGAYRRPSEDGILSGTQTTNEHFGEDSPIDFQRVEGFSIQVSKGKLELPIYRAVLAEPDRNGWREVKLTFKFEDAFEAPIVILREGQILTSEEDWPVNEFLAEVDKIQPLRDHSYRYMCHGLLNLMLAAFFGHLGRVLTDRPWPICFKEIVLISCAMLPAVLFATFPDQMMMRVLNVDAPLLTDHQASKRKQLVQHMRAFAGATTAQSWPRGQSFDSTESDAQITEITGIAMGDEVLKSPQRNPDARTPASKDPLSPRELLAASDRSRSRLSLPRSASRGSCSTARTPSSSAAKTRTQPVRTVTWTSTDLDLEEGGPPQLPPERSEKDIASSRSLWCCSGVGGAAVDTNGTEWCPADSRADDEEAEICCSPTGTRFAVVRQQTALRKQKSVRLPAEDLDPNTSEGEASPADDGIASHAPSYWSMMDDARSDVSEDKKWFSRCVPRLPERCTQLLNGLTRLDVFRRMIQVLWLLSISWIVSPLVAQGFDLTEIGAAGRASSTALSPIWLEQEVAWPSPFFTPSAMVLRGDTLWVAADWLLLAVPARTGSASPVTPTQRWRLPVAAVGLINPSMLNGDHEVDAHDNESQNVMFVAGSTELQSIIVDEDSAVGSTPMSLESHSVGRGLMDMFATSAVRTSSLQGQPIELPSEVSLHGSPQAVAAASLPGLGKDIVAVAPPTGGVYLSAAASLLSNKTSAKTALQVAVWAPQHVPAAPKEFVAGEFAAAPTAPVAKALHLCVDGSGCGAGGPVLWAVESPSNASSHYLCLTAVSLSSGRLLGSWNWPPVASFAASPPPSTALPAALAGNATHLIGITSRHGSSAPVVVVARYSDILESQLSDAGVCAHSAREHTAAR